MTTTDHTPPADFYAMHDHGHGYGERHAHHVNNPHSGDVNSPRADDHSGVPVVTQAEATAAPPTTDHTTSPPLDAAALNAIEARAEAAHQHVVKLCSGEERWTMRVPAEPGRDSDLVIDDALQDIGTLLAEVRRLSDTLDRTRQQLRDEAARLMLRPAHPPVAADTAWWLRRLAECPVCSGPSRETAGLVCQACGKDWGAKEDPNA